MSGGAFTHHRALWPVRCDDTEEIIANYAIYVQSKHWKRIKVLFKHSPFHKGRCYVCGSKEKLELHHKTYERIGHENLDDLQELCDLCHSLAHQLAMTGKQMGVTIGNAAEAMLGEKEPGTYAFAEGGREEYKATRSQGKPRRKRRRGYHSGRTAGTPPKALAKPGWGVPKSLETTKPTLYECSFCRNIWQGILSRKGIYCPNRKKKRTQFDVRLACPPASSLEPPDDSRMNC